MIAFLQANTAYELNEAINACQAKVHVYIGQKEIKGIIEQSGQEYITISNPQTGEWYILPTIFMNYIVFEENINYN